MGWVRVLKSCVGPESKTDFNALRAPLFICNYVFALPSPEWLCPLTYSFYKGRELPFAPHGHTAGTPHGWTEQ